MIPYTHRVEMAAEILGMDSAELSTKLAAAPADEWLLPEEAAALMGISPTALARRRQRGNAPEYKTLGERTYRYLKSSVMEASHARN